MDCSPPSPSVHGISQAKILKWVVISFSRGSSWPRDQTHVFCIGFIIAKLLGKPPTAMTLKSFRMREGLGLKNTTRATRKCLNKWSREMRTCWMTRWRKEEHKIYIFMERFHRKAGNSTQFILWSYYHPVTNAKRESYSPVGQTNVPLQYWHKNP